MSALLVAVVGRGCRLIGRSILMSAIVASMLACSSGPEKPKPAELKANVPLINTRLAWSASVGAVNFPLEVAVSRHAGVVAATVAGSDGTVVSMDALTGREVWRTQIGTTITAGVGSDGVLAAVISSANEVVVVDGGRVLWRQKMSASSYTSPLVAAGRVFVLGLDRSITAFDGRTGRRLWMHKRASESLVLRQAGVLLAVDDTVVAGLSGRLVGLNPLDGSIRWEVPVATARGTNDVERIVDVVGRVSHVGDVVCARAFGAAIGCVDAVGGKLLWSKPASGSEGVHGNERTVFGVEQDGKVIAWNRKNGERLWSSERLQYRTLTGPVVVGRAIAIGDSTGLVHMISVEDGSPLTRLTTDGSAVAAAPALAAQMLIVVTRTGGIYGYSPQ